MKLNPMKNIITFRAELPTAEALEKHLLGEQDDDLIQAWMDDAATKVFLLNYTTGLLTTMLEYREEDKEQEVS